MRFSLGLSALFVPLALIGASVPAASQTTATPKATHRATTPRAAKPAEPALPPVTLPAEPGRYAVFYTSQGTIVCRLFDKDAPKTVANFVGLATGTKAWTDPATGKLVHRPLYSGTIFHRVIPDFMIQGGDPLATGEGSPGYQFADEFSPDRHFDQPGILAMANSGPNTNGSQFFITVAPTPWLNGKHSIFGEVVSGQEIADAISKVARDSSDKPETPVTLTRVVIRRVAAPPTTPGTPAKPGVTPPAAQ